MELDFPKLQLYMSVLAHLAPRVLKYSRAVSRIIAVNASIVPGCGKAIAFTRALLYDVLETAHWAVPRAVPRTYVDDMSQRASGTTAKQMCWDLLCWRPRARRRAAEEAWAEAKPKSGGCCH